MTIDKIEKISKEKKIVLFGVGRLTWHFLSVYEGSIEMIVDSDAAKQNYQIEEFTNENSIRNIKTAKIVIQSPSRIKYLDPKKTVVLIASRIQFVEIINQIRAMGYSDYILIKDIEGIEKYGLELSDKRKIENKKIVVDVARFGEHGVAITKELKKMSDDLDIVWIIRTPQKKRTVDGIRYIYDSNIEEYIREMETAKIWIFDRLIPDYVKKRKGQIYIQTKHWSSVTLKKFYADDKNLSDYNHTVESVKRNAGLIDYIVSGSEFDEKTCRSGFCYNGKFKRFGSARSDLLFFGDKEKVKEELGINGSIILYVPTHRNKEAWELGLDINCLKKAAKRRFGGKWVLLIRLHPQIANNTDKVEENEDLINVSSYSDSQKLILAADIVISDYSSIMFEAAYVNKPVFLYAPDKEDYLEKESSFLIDYDTLPFPICMNNEKLISEIERFDQKEYERCVEDFLNSYGVHEDGHASERVANWILELIDN